MTTIVRDQELRTAIEAKTARLAIVGCGYVGLPLALAYAQAGFDVVGIDTDARRVQRMNTGESHILDVPSDALRASVDAGRFKATTDYAVTADADIVFISVPTPFDRAKQPDLHFIVAAAEGLAPYIHSGQLIVLESTTFPGTTDEVLKPILERGGLEAGVDFFLAFSPERIDPGNKRFRIGNTPKVVGGVSPASTELAVLALQQIVREGGVVPVSSARAAELTKLLENTFRAVNIALVNELAMLCNRMKIDLWEVIDAAATKPYGYMPFYPGPGVGGHCIPVDPYYLSWKAREFDFHTKFIELAAETNLAMPFFAASRIERLITRNGVSGRPRVLALGATFKPDIDDARNSAALRVIEILHSNGADVSYHDPFVPRVTILSEAFEPAARLTLESVPLNAESVRAVDCVAILVRHTGVDYDMVVRHARLVFDAVNATKGTKERQGIERL
jgi:UDP-N-acetyl-D-glucosamine dehydrogenase